MKSSEAKPLSVQELQTLKGLLQRWVLCSYPFDGGSSEESDAYATYRQVADDAGSGKDMQCPSDDDYFEPLSSIIKKHGESQLD